MPHRLPGPSVRKAGTEFRYPLADAYSPQTTSTMVQLENSMNSLLRI